MAIVVAAINPFDLISRFQVSTNIHVPEGSSSSSIKTKDDHIVATPEMISEAMQELKIKKMQEHETAESQPETFRNYYIIELYSGGDLEASDVVIRPDTVTITSDSGIETIISRNSIKDIRRYQIPVPRSE